MSGSKNKRWRLVDFGFDLAGRSEPRLWRGALLSAAASFAEALPFLVALVVLDGVFRGSAQVSWIGWVVATLLAAYGLTQALKSRGGIHNFKATYGLVADIRLRLVEKLRRLPMGYWSSKRTGAVSSVITDEFCLYQDITTHAWGMVVANSALPVAFTVILFLVDWRLALVGISTVPFALRAVPWSYRILDRAADQLAEVRERAVAQLVEYVQGIRTLREYGRTGENHERLAAVLRELERQMMHTELAPAPAIFSYRFLVYLGFPVVVAVGAWMVAEDWLSPTRFLLFIILSIPLYAALADLGIFLAVTRFVSRTLTRIRRIFDEEEQDNPATGPSPDGHGIHINSVDFSYGDRAALLDIEARILPGTVTALVGPSGSGKTTLAHLIARLWDVGAGSIDMGGVDIRTMPLSNLHKRVAMVFQDVVLFQDTVEENIRLARPTASREEVEAAARAARAHMFIEQFSDGYDTVLGEGGHDLSGGQRQRISIARALLKDAPILVLDEATSSIDSHNERLIQEALSTLMTGRTVIIVAHRLWTIQHADQILVLDEGRIVERGRHSDLLANKGLYGRMWKSQQASRTWRIKGVAPSRNETNKKESCNDR